MATRKRDIVPSREKPASLSQTGTTKLRGSPNQPSKSITKRTLNSTAPHKQLPTSLRSSTTTTTTARVTATNVSKQPRKKPISVDTARKPTQPKRTSLHKPLTPTQKPRLLNNSSLRSSSFPGKAAVSQKPVPVRNLKTVAKDAGRRVCNGRSSSSGIKKQETGNTTSAVKEEITYSPEKVATLSISSVVESETQLQYQECSVAEAEEKTVQIVGSNEKGTDDIVPEDQESLDVAKTEAESDHNKDTTKNVIAVETPTVFEHQEDPVEVKPQESEDKYQIEEKSTNQTNTCDKGEILAGDSHDEAGEEEVKEVEVVEEEQETVLSKKDEVASGDEAQESKEGQEVVAEKKQEPENVSPKQQERVHGKKDSAVSNNVIEETASKLREQRKNKVKALAGAFETVISLQGDSY